MTEIRNRFAGFAFRPTWTYCHNFCFRWSNLFFKCNYILLKYQYSQILVVTCRSLLDFLLRKITQVLMRVRFQRLLECGFLQRKFISTQQCFAVIGRGYNWLLQTQVNTPGESRIGQQSSKMFSCVCLLLAATYDK